MLQNLRSWFRRRRRWLEFQEARREGFGRVLTRRHYQRQILGTLPLRTGRSGPVEVRVLTWRRDWINVIWAVKSYYHFAGVDYPLYIHDGGMAPGQDRELMRHFPDATYMPAPEADRFVAEELTRRGLKRALAYRAKNPSTRKLFDFFLKSTADYQVCIDSDIVFFSRPDLLIVPPEGVPVNRYNRDTAFWYSMTPDEMDAAFGVKPPERINSGLAVIARSSIDFDAIDRWLENPKLFADAWVTEQTLHALCSTVHGVEFLPDTYMIGTEPGMCDGIVCKHYPGYMRYALYSEGMKKLIDEGFLKALESGRRHTAPVAGPAATTA